MHHTPPEVTFWDRNAPKLELINGSDLRISRLVDQLGIGNDPLVDSLATSDADEIRRRQDVLATLLRAPKLTPEILEGAADSAEVPQTHADFLRHFEGERLWDGPYASVLDLLQRATRSETNTELRQMTDFLLATREEQRERERDFAAAIGDQIRRMMEFSAIVRIEPTGTEEPEVEYVTGAYCFRYDRKRNEWPMPPWADPDHSFLWALTAPVRAAVRRHNRRARERFFRPTLVDHVPTDVKRTLRNALHNVFRRLSEESEVYGRHDPDIRRPWRVLVKYQDDQLRAWFLNTTVLDSCGVIPFGAADRPRLLTYRELSPEEQQRIRDQNREIERCRVQAERTQKVIEALEEIESGLIDARGVGLNNASLGPERWQALADLLTYNSERHEQYQQIVEYREYLGTALRKLSKLAKLAGTIRERAEDWGLSYSFPEILSDDEHLVSFSRLDPIHLIGRDRDGARLSPKDLVPIGAEMELNGQMLTLTGQNAGGKTVIEESIAYAVYLAQSGLPIFGYNMRLNPKDTLGLVFLERGEGSTLELMLEKANRVVGAAQQRDANKMLVILDELGTGTQPEQAMGVAQRILERLRSAGCSVLFSTQISQLAETARESYGAQSYGVDLNHQVTPGIRTGGVEELIDTRKFTALQ